MSPRKRKALGDCYEVAGRLATLGNDGNMTLVHGLVMGAAGGTATEGVRHGHAWVEIDEIIAMPDDRTVTVTMVIDKSNGNDVYMPKALYYNYGEIRREDVRRYTASEARRRMLDSGHFGPWEDGPQGQKGD